MKIIIFLCLFLTALVSHADVVFEGYYKVSQFDKHIGFIIIRHEIEPKTNHFVINTFLRLSKKNFDLTESTRTVSSSDLKPIEYSYIGADKQKSKTIEASVKGDKLIGMATENKSKIKISTVLPKGVFFSSALYPFMLRSKDGLKTGADFKFSALAEESALVFEGTAVVAPKRVSQGIFQLLKIDNSFAGSSYENLLSDTGEIISSNDSKSGIKTELVKSKEEAIQDIKINSKNISQIFGSVPEGKINSLNVKK